MIDNTRTDVSTDYTVIPSGYYFDGRRVCPGRYLIEQSVRVLLDSIDDANRQGLLETPARVARMLVEMTQGYRVDPEQLLAHTFEETYDEIVISKDIPFTSLCEHHLLPFTGTIDIGYLPTKIVGLSKLARLVDCFSMRLQLQERLTREIAESIQRYLLAKGVAVVCRAAHSCMSCRGVRKSGSEMITSVMLGVFREDAQARAEFLSLCK